MKKILLIAFAVAATVSCHRTIDVGQVAPDVPQAPGDVISLAAFSDAAVTMATVPGQGVRKDFIVGDQIALFAAYGNDRVGSAPTGPDWVQNSDPKLDSANQVGPYFINWPAYCTIAGATSPTASAAKFQWGLLGTGGVGVDRIYPRGDRAVYMYAYYPFYMSDTVTLDPAKGPQLKIELKNNAVITADVEHVQPDILFAQGKSKGAGSPAPGLDTIKRSDPLAPLVFNHALAQINFKVQLDKGAAECKFNSIQFFTPKEGVLNITDGVVTVTEPVSEPTDADAAGWMEYKIEHGKGEPIPVPTTEPDADPKVFPLYVLENNPLMIMPQTIAQAQKCRLWLTVYYGTEDPDSDTANLHTYKVNLNNAAMKAIVQGKKTTLTLTMNRTHVNLEASITPWGENTDNPTIPVE